jgi:hypothetical protein
MDFVKELFWVLAMASLPVGIFTMAIVRWAMRNGHLDDITDANSMQLKLKALSKQKIKKGEVDKRDFVHKKWSKFGGGFYGIVALLTYVVVEAREIIDLVVHLGGFIEFIKHLNVGTMISMLINAFMNFVYAIAWPWYWIENIDTNFIWLWFIAAYAGYWGGMRIALMQMQRKTPLL